VVSYATAVAQDNLVYRHTALSCKITSILGSVSVPLILLPPNSVVVPLNCHPPLAPFHSQPTSCPFTSPMPPISSHSSSSAIAPMDLPSTGTITCSTAAAPAAQPGVSGRPFINETPNIIGRQQDTYSTMKVSDDQGNLRFSAVRNGPAAGLGEIGPRHLCGSRRHWGDGAA
jgi:hypothetical protein